MNQAPTYYVLICRADGERDEIETGDLQDATIAADRAVATGAQWAEVTDATLTENLHRANHDLYSL